MNLETRRTPSKTNRSADVDGLTLEFRKGTKSSVETVPGWGCTGSSDHRPIGSGGDDRRFESAVNGSRNECDRHRVDSNDRTPSRPSRVAATNTTHDRNDLIAGSQLPVSRTTWFLQTGRPSQHERPTNGPPSRWPSNGSSRSSRVRAVIQRPRSTTNDIRGTQRERTSEIGGWQSSDAAIGYRFDRFVRWQ